jgi:hypothetical protein
MLRAVLCALLLVAPACHHDEPPPLAPKEGELPPLPSSSGTLVGYLVDNAGQLQLRDDQLTKLREMDASLAARDGEIETQIRLIEKPAEDPDVPKGAPPPRHNNAPGAQVRTNGDAAKLHEQRKAVDDEALQKAFALLDPDQQTTARKLLEDRGVAAPGSKIKPRQHDPNDGVPLEP